MKEYRSEQESCEWEKKIKFTDTLLKVKRGEKWGLVDETGDLVTPCRWDDIRKHRIIPDEDVWFLAVSGDGKYGTNEFNKKVNMKWQALYSYKLKFDFKDENALSYLNGKSFEVKEVPFK